MHPQMLAAIALLRITRDVLRSDDAAIRMTLDAAGFDMDALPTLPVRAQLAVLSAEIHAGSRDSRIAPALQGIRAVAEPAVDFEIHMRAGLLLAAHHECIGLHLDAKNLLSELLPLLENSRALRFAVDCPALKPLLERMETAFAARLLMNMQTNRTSRLPFNLTSREHDILQLAASGLATHEIARRINMTRASVYTYLSRIYRKMNVSARRDALHIYRQIEE